MRFISLYCMRDSLTDPCCGDMQGNITTVYETPFKVRKPPGLTENSTLCKDSNAFPCGLTGAACYLDLKHNRNFDDLINSRLNTSCNCGKVEEGYVWDPVSRLCAGL